MELHGSKDYFGCNKAILVTNGKIMPDAIEVANRLQIELQIIACPDEINEAEKSVLRSSKLQKNKERSFRRQPFPLLTKSTHSIPFGKNTLYHSKEKLCIIVMGKGKIQSQTWIGQK